MYRHGFWRLLLTVVVCGAALFGLTGCEDEDYDYDPPEGFGALTVDNETYNDFYVYIDGVEQVRAPYRGRRSYEREPGVYRVLLDERDGTRSFAGDVDILEGRETVILLRDAFFDDLNVDVFID